ncbi:MAG: mechanosensitive ion channel domain-containing protein [Methylovulum sp.]
MPIGDNFTSAHSPQRRWIWLWFGILLTLSPYYNVVLASSIPGISSKKAATSANDVANIDMFADHALLAKTIQKQLDTAQDDLARLLADRKAQPKVSETVQTNTRQFYVEMLIHTYEAQLERLAELNAIQERSAAEEYEASTLTTSDESQPISFLKEDELRESMGVLDKHSVGLEKMLVLIDLETQRRVDAIENSAAKLRQADEVLEKIRSKKAPQTFFIENRDILVLQNRVDSSRLVNLKIEKQLIEQKLLETRRKRSFIEKEVDNNPVAYAQITQQDIAVTLKNLEDQRKDIIAELTESISEVGAEKLKEKPLTQSLPPETGDSLRHLQKENEGFKLQALYLMLDSLQFQQLFWELRWSHTQISDREKARIAYARIAKDTSNLQAIQQYVEHWRQLTLDAISAQTKTASYIKASSSSGQDDALQTVYIDRVIIFSRLLAALDTTENLLNRFKQDLDKRFRVKTIADRLHDFWLNVRELGTTIWEYEIFAAQDMIDVDGRKINIQRSITIDKVLTALMILIFGYWLAAKLVQLMENIAVRRFGMNTSLARIARRWILFVAVLILLTASLLVVRIPLTVFAFMGGAMAIGAGFGMQNLFKNLISGLMLLLERPFRPGDLVEVGDIRGRIIDIGMRSSHIRDANGIETLIPNSTFIEEKVTNWTLSSQSVRIVIKIGVAYGSPVQDVSDLLLQAAERHGLVLDKPPPQVLFEDFGSDALLFGLYIWVELRPELDWRTVASDLRYIINKTFAAKGISIAFPQRDVHLDAKQPLEIRVLPNV